MENQCFCDIPTCLASMYKRTGIRDPHYIRKTWMFTPQVIVRKRIQLYPDDWFNSCVYVGSPLSAAPPCYTVLLHRRALASTNACFIGTAISLGRNTFPLQVKILNY